MKQTITLTSRIILKENLVERLQAILDIDEGHFEGAGRDSVIHVFSTSVSHGEHHFGVDIKVCNGDTPYVDPVLFNIDFSENGEEIWSEIYPLGVEDVLLGDYEFETDEGDTTFIIQVSVIPEEHATAEEIAKYGVHE